MGRTFHAVALLVNGGPAPSFLRAESGEFDALSRPLAPPWEKHPEIGYSSIGWRMGYGEAYMERWRAFYDGLSPAGRLRYRQMFPAPEDWTGFYEA